jgi:hypothetical protein
MRDTAQRLRALILAVLAVGAAVPIAGSAVAQSSGNVTVSDPVDLPYNVTINVAGNPNLEEVGSINATAWNSTDTLRVDVLGINETHTMTVGSTLISASEQSDLVKSGIVPIPDDQRHFDQYRVSVNGSGDVENVTVQYGGRFVAGGSSGGGLWGGGDSFPLEWAGIGVLVVAAAGIAWREYDA